MTNEEAAAILESEAEYLYSQDEPYNRQAFNMAIEALQERKTGKWLYDISRCDAIEAMFILPRCSICGSETPHPKAIYCPNCGAKMEVDE